MITLAQLAKNSNNKLVRGFINELITDSFLLSAMQFDDVLDSNGESNLVYAYNRVVSPASAQIRTINQENETFSEPAIEQYSASPAILNSQFQVDRVTAQAGPSLVALRVAEAKNAIIRKFNAGLIRGGVAADSEAGSFDGLSKALTDSSTELTSFIDLSTADLIKANALAFSFEMDALLGKLSSDPTCLLVNPAMATKISQVCRVLGTYQTTTDTAGKRTVYWDGIPIQPLTDGALVANDIYAVTFASDGFHGFTLKGGQAITVNPPDLTGAGAIKKGDVEFVVGCALKATKAAAVLRAYLGSGTTLKFADSASFNIPASVTGTPITPIDVSTGVTGGTTPYSFGAAGLPAGIAIATATGVISGTPTTAGDAGNAVLTVSDSASTPARANIGISFGAVTEPVGEG